MSEERSPLRALVSLFAQGITAIFSQIILGEFEQRYDPYLIDPRTIVTINKENVVLEVNHPLMDEVGF